MNNSTIALTLARGIRLSAVAALLTCLLAVTHPARALTYEVENTNDSGPGSLRKAITLANNNPGADTINFAAATNGNPIVLAGSAGENANASGDLDILDGGDLTIQGNGAGNTIIDGGGIDRVFHVCPVFGCANTVTFTGVTIRNGNVTGGGGILNTTTLNVQSSTIGGAGAGNKAIRGGGIYNAASDVTVDGSTVSANTATDHGGGIYNATGGTTTVIGSTIGGAGAANQATNYGGGIYNKGATTVDGSTVSANTAHGGGGIYNYDTLYVQNGSTIGGAGAGNTARYGGGIYNKAGTTTVDGSTVSANTGHFGGGIYNRDGTTTVSGSRVLNNTATGGGGVFNDRDVAWATSVTGSCIVNNSATSFYNNTYAQQIATGNWWGAATGPNTPGADTVSEKVDTDGYLTEPILGCDFYVYLPLLLKQTP